MTVNTQPLATAAPKGTGKSSDGRVADKGQESPQETAARFQAMIKDARTGEAPAKGERRTGLDDALPGESEAAADGAEGSKEGEAGAMRPGQASSGEAQYSTKTLTDALRQVSQNVLAPKATGETVDENGKGEQKASGRGGGSPLLMASSTLALNSASGSRPAQTAVPAGNAMPVQTPVPSQAGGQTADADAATKSEGTKTGTSSLFAQFGVEPEKVSDTAMRGPGLPEEAAGTVKILRQETHFAPNMRLSPAQQVGDQIAGALKELAAESSRASAGLTAKAEGPVLKTLDIQLTPHELGTVKVSLRMVGDNVEVSLVTSKAQTAELLKHDRQLLDQMLRTTGFKADTITIQAADDRIAVQHTSSSSSGNSATGQNGAGNGAQGEGQAHNFGGNGSGQQGGRAGGDSRQSAFATSEALKGNGHEEDAGVSLSDGIYL